MCFYKFAPTTNTIYLRRKSVGRVMQNESHRNVHQTTCSSVWACLCAYHREMIAHIGTRSTTRGALHLFSQPRCMKPKLVYLRLAMSTTFAYFPFEMHYVCDLNLFILQSAFLFQPKRQQTRQFSCHFQYKNKTQLHI